MISSRRLALDSHRRLSGRIAEGKRLGWAERGRCSFQTNLTFLTISVKQKSKTFGCVDKSSEEVLWET